MTIFAQICKHRTMHRIYGWLSFVTFALSLFFLSYLTLEYAVVSAMSFTMAIVFKVYEVKERLKKRDVFERGLEQIVEEYFKENPSETDYELSFGKGYTYFIRHYNYYTVETVAMKIEEYSKKAKIRIKLYIGTMALYENLL